MTNRLSHLRPHLTRLRAQGQTHGGLPPPGRRSGLTFVAVLALAAVLTPLLVTGVRRRLARQALHASVAPISTPARIQPAPDLDAGLTIAVVGDFGRCHNDGVECENEKAVAQLVDSWSPDYVITTGDNNYPRGEVATMAINLDPYRKYIEEGRFLPALGNHDWGCRECPRPHLNQFNPPGNGRYYFLPLGNLGVWVVDSDKQEPDGVEYDSVQARWLRDGLARNRDKLNLVFLHHPPYSSGHHGSSRYMRWPFADWGADGVFAGHEHSYERLEVEGIQYFVNGSAGAGLRGFRRPLPGTRVRYAAAHGAQRIVFDGETAIMEFWDTRRQKVDSVALSRRKVTAAASSR